MKTAFKTSFLKDVKKAPITLLPELNIIITESEKASSLREITNLKKLKGHDIAYRIKLKQFRICFYYANDVIIFTKFLPRKDVYKFFP